MPEIATVIGTLAPVRLLIWKVEVLSELVAPMTWVCAGPQKLHAADRLISDRRMPTVALVSHAA